jgi:hypothetical protein
LNKGSLFKKEFYDIFYPLLGYVSLNNPALSRAYEHVGVINIKYIRSNKDYQHFKEIINVL